MAYAHQIAVLQSTIYTALHGRMHRRDDPYAAFICEEDIKAVWTNPETKLLWAFGELLQWTADEISIVRFRQLKILSLLVLINFKDWATFSRFYLSGHNGLTDDSLPITGPRRLLECFPHDPAFRDQFLEKQYMLLPIKVAEDDDGINEQSRWSPYHRLPSILSLPMGSGVAGIVTKELIAARHIRRIGGHENSEVSTSILQLSSCLLFEPGRMVGLQTYQRHGRPRFGSLRHRNGESATVQIVIDFKSQHHAKLRYNRSRS